MPALAVPYLVPYAKMAGLAIGSVATALGLKALSDKVQAHMEDNPEESMKILTMIMPEQGIAALFNKKAGEDKVEEEVEVEEEVSSGSEVEEKIKEILVEEGVNVDEVDLGELPKDLQAKVMKGVAKSLGGRSMAEASSILGLSGSARDVKRMADEADVRHEGGVEDVPTPKFDWRSRWRKKAQGGRIGYDDGQLVKPGLGRPGYNGQGDYTPDRSPGRTAPGGGAGRDILTGQ